MTLSGSNPVARLLTAVSMLLGASCTSPAQHGRIPARSALVLSSGVPVALREDNHLPAPYARLGIRTGWALPSGWRLDPFGIHRTANWLVFGANRSSQGGVATRDGAPEPMTYTWVINAYSGRGYRYAPLHRGWFSPLEIVVAGWLLRKEAQQLPDEKCSSSTSADDCFRWRIYGQRIGSADARLIAQSEIPGSQSFSATPVTDGRTAFWETRLASGAFAISRWEPTIQVSRVITKRRQSGVLQVADGRTFDIESSSPSQSREPVHRVFELSKDTRLLQRAQYVGTSLPAIRGERYLYFNRDGVTSAPYRLASFGSALSVAVGESVTDPYSASWLSRTAFLSWSYNGLQVLDTRSRHSSFITPSDSRLVAPRSDAGYVMVGFNPSPKNAVLGVLPLRP
jgi:hypothetical protein